jgi:myo-inositol-1(or 4)-monophosphatase
MTSRSWDINDIISIVENVAENELKPRFANVKNVKKDDGSLLTEADIIVQNKIRQSLMQIDTDVLFLSEEMSNEEQLKLIQQTDSSIWILDPLDGTTNFSSGIPYYAISLALIKNGQVELGIVYDPERKECFFAEKGQGAKLQTGKQIPISLNGLNKVSQLCDAVACVDLKRLPEAIAVKIVTQHPFRSQRSFGGVALDWCWLAAGRFDVYLHGKQNIWDYAAGQLIFSESGGASSTLAGEPVFSNKLEARTGIGAGNATLFAEWSDWLKKAHIT